MKHYHFIFTGTGLAALMTVREMILSGKFKNHSILLLDQNAKKSNDRTWCFWETENERSFQDITAKEWHCALFKNNHFERKMKLNPYRYKMLRGSDFYRSLFSLLEKEPNITFLQQEVVGMEEQNDHCVVTTNKDIFFCNRIINSIYDPEIPLKQQTFPTLQQHFVGWFIKSEELVFQTDCAIFMDFSVPQSGNTRFMYVLPFSQNEALIEYTLFSKDLLPKAEYETAIKDYITNLGISRYEMLEKEQGSIPMTCFPFWKRNSKHIIHIGSAGGWTKASTGFTFKNTIKKSKELCLFLELGKDLRLFHKKNRFWFYDLLLLDILARQNDQGKNIFSAMFQKGKAPLVFKFLDEETSLAEDLQIILQCPKKLFVKALLGRLFQL